MGWLKRKRFEDAIDIRMASLKDPAGPVAAYERHFKDGPVGWWTTDYAPSRGPMWEEWLFQPDGTATYYVGQLLCGLSPEWDFLWVPLGEREIGIGHTEEDGGIVRGIIRFDFMIDDRFGYPEVVMVPRDVESDHTMFCDGHLAYRGPFRGGL
jgi:hypothetical protein